MWRGFRRSALGNRPQRASIPKPASRLPSADLADRFSNLRDIASLLTKARAIHTRLRESMPSPATALLRELRPDRVERRVMKLLAVAGLVVFALTFA